MAVRLLLETSLTTQRKMRFRQHFSAVGNLSYVSIPLDRETGKKEASLCRIRRCSAGSSGDPAIQQ